ncbi:MAG: DUF1289 domain-containing protein [Pseudomonadota bacterium]
MSVTSPCTGICKLEPETGWCLGCGRSGSEIADWRNHPEPWRSAVWEEIPRRLRQIGVGFQRLPWTTEDIRDFVMTSLDRNEGTWVMGVVGAVAEFTGAPGSAISVTPEGDALLAYTRGAAMRMLIDDDIRALTFDPEGASSKDGSEGQGRIVLAVKRERGRMAAIETVTDVGEDRGRLIEDRETRLYDLGLGRKEARFCVRVAPGASREALRRVEGQPFAEALPYIGAPLVAESPTRVVETPLGRIEIEGQIPPAGARSPAGPHTHLLPDHLATGRALPVGMDLPRAYLPGAIFYPRA